MQLSNTYLLAITLIWAISLKIANANITVSAAQIRAAIRYLPPSVDPERPTAMLMEPVFMGLVGVNERDGRVSYLGSLMTTWRDGRTLWSMDECEHDTLEIFPASKIWTPWLWNQNGRFENIDNKLWDQTPIMLTNTGAVYWLTGKIYEVICDFDMAVYPTDTQHCQLTFYITGNTQVEAGNYTLDASIPEHQLWRIEAMPTQQRKVTFGRVTLKIVDFRFKMIRRVPYYIYTLILPTAVLWPLPSMVFIVPPDNGEKMSIALTTLLTYFVLALSFFDKLPESEVLSTIGLLFLYQLFVSAAAALFAALILLKVDHEQQDLKSGKAKSSIYSKIPAKLLNWVCFGLFLTAGLIIPTIILAANLKHE